MKSRDNFPKRIVTTVAERAGHQCSNPECGQPTVGPGERDISDVARIGVAAHITAAAEGGPRFAPNQSLQERKSIGNAIHLCQNCAKLVDANGGRDYSVEKLCQWKSQHEAKIRVRLSSPAKNRRSSEAGSLTRSAEKIIQRVQRFEDEFLYERNRSFSGNDRLVMDRQKIMDDLLILAIRDLRAELALFPTDAVGTESIQKTAMAMMRHYRHSGETCADGRPFWGPELASKALLEMDGAKDEFQHACKNLREQMKTYLVL